MITITRLSVNENKFDGSFTDHLGEEWEFDGTYVLYSWMKNPVEIIQISSDYPDELTDSDYISIEDSIKHLTTWDGSYNDLF